MPVLRKIVVQNFRNIELQELDFSAKLNCITGGNGEGKTNLLDAIWYLSMTKSAFTADRLNIRYGASSFAISGTYELPSGLSTRIAIQAGGEKRIRRDDKPYARLSEHIGLLPVVMVSPSDVTMVSESGDERRRFANSVISQMDREYLDAVQQYTRFLSQRNSFLRSGSPDEGLMDVLDEKMSPLAERIVAGRDSFARGIAPLVKDFYERISGGKEAVAVHYRSQLQKGTFKDLMAENRQRDLALGYTFAGVQRDDFAFEMNGHAIRNCGSQGQQKSFLVALKFAQYGIMKERSGVTPILLLDDLFDKLDMGRVQNLLQTVAGEDFGQIFLSDSNKLRVNSIVDSITEDRSYFEAAGGVFTRL